MTYELKCKLRGVEFKYKVEANNLTDAKVKVRNHIKNAIEIEVIQSNDDAVKDLFGFFDKNIFKK